MLDIDVFSKGPAAEHRFRGLRFNRQSGTFHAASGEPLTLRPKSEQVMRALASRAGCPVMKDDLFEIVWPDVAVTDDSLVQCISEIRRALGDCERQTLRTISKRGYMLVPDDAWSGTPERIGLSICEPIRFVTTSDDVKIAWTASGRPDGIPVLKAPNWIWHLGHERESLVYTPYHERLGAIARIVRFDQRGIGMSDWMVPPLTHDLMVNDMETVAEAAGLERFFINAVSQGVGWALIYAARNPERVLGIIGQGGFLTGHLASGRPERRKVYEAALAMIEAGWDEEDPTFRRYFASRILPDVPRAFLKEFTELARISASGENFIRFTNFLAHTDLRDYASQVRVPMLYFHAMRDRIVPYYEGETIASLVPDIRFIPLDTENHIPVPGTETYKTIMSESEAFLSRHAGLTSLNAN